MTNQWNVTLDENGTLSSQHAFELYEQGVEVWNAFMKEYPATIVNFRGFNFPDYLDVIDFSNFQFPKGVSFSEVNFSNRNVLFWDTKFGDGKVSFHRATFGSGEVSFWYSNFGDGDVSFEQVEFGNGKTSFEKAKFGSGNIIFTDANFGDGEASFWKAIFGDGDILFSNTKFGNDEVLFDSAVFGKGNIYFWATNFGDSTVSFDEVKFGNGTISFDQAIFGDRTISFDETDFNNGAVSFDEARFGNGEVLFKGTKFGDGEVLFSYTEFGSGNVLFVGAKFSNSRVSFQKANFGVGEVSFWNAIFEGSTFNFDDVRCESLNFTNTSFSSKVPTDSETIFSMERANISKSLLLPNLDFRSFKSVSFRGTSIGTLFDIEGSQFAQLPDLTATTINGHFSVDRIHVDTPKTFTKGDATKARRLKELAKKSEDRKTQLDMLALELDAMTATKDIPLLSRWLNIGYKWVSNYGRSIARPFFGLIFFCVLFTGFHISFSEKENTSQDALLLSISQSIPFLSSSRTITQTSLTALYGVEEAETENEAPRPPLNNNLVEWAGLFQNLLSYICLFFIGLGIRNRFKL